MRKTILYVVIAILTVFLAACGTAGNVNLENEDVNMNENESNENNLNDQEQTGGQDDPAGGQEDEQMPLRETSDLIVKALSEQDLETLASYVHPETGVRFSPYTDIDEDNDLTFSKDDIPGLLEDDTVYTWGTWDGSGEPLENTFAEYYEAFIYDADYESTTEVGLNERIGQGNTIDNATEVYPDATIVEYHHPGDEEDLAGLDWSSLRLVLEMEEGEWLLIGIVHDEWTI